MLVAVVFVKFFASAHSNCTRAASKLGLAQTIAIDVTILVRWDFYNFLFGRRVKVDYLLDSQRVKRGL
jgi:hypothetical protein